MLYIDLMDDKIFVVVYYLFVKEWGGMGIYKYCFDNIIKVIVDN